MPKPVQSAASTVRDGLGGLDGEGRALASGDVLTAASNELSLRELPASAERQRRYAASPVGQCRLVTGRLVTGRAPRSFKRHGTIVATYGVDGGTARVPLGRLHRLVHGPR